MRTAQASLALGLCLLVCGAPASGQTPATPPSPAMPAAPAAPGPTPPAALPPGVPPAAVGHPLSLDEAIAIALETQPLIQARLSDYLAAAYRVDQAFSPLLPQLGASVTVARTQSAQQSSGLRVGTGGLIVSSGQPRTVTSIRDPAENTRAVVSLSQVLFDFGKTFASTDAARRLAEQAQENVELQRQLITLAVKESFININFARRLIRVQEQALERADLNLRSARGFFEVGTRPKSDVARAEVDVANARLDLIRARNAEQVARVGLNTAMGIAADAPTDVQDNLVYEETTVNRGQLLGEALAQRPEYKQARLRVSEAEARMRRAFRDFFPDVTANAFYGGTRTDLNEIWEVGVALSWTIFDGGNRIARFRETKASVESAQATVRSTELDIGREVEQAQLIVNEGRERIAAAQVAVASAQENFRLAQGRFDAGVGTILELTDAQLFLTQAQNTEAQALADYRIAVARLERAIGRR
jgi:outer membrane protein